MGPKMAVDERQIRDYEQAAKALGDKDFLGSAFTDSLNVPLDIDLLQENQNIADAETHDHDPGKEHRDALNKKAHDYAVKGGSDEGAVAGLRMKQVSASGTSAGGGKSKKEKQSRKAVVDEMLRQLADTNRQIQWYENEISLLTQDLARVESELEQSRERLSELEALIELRDDGEFDPENNPEHTARLRALGISVEEYVADPRILDQSADAERNRAGDLVTQEQDLKTKIDRYVLEVDDLEKDRNDLSKELVELGSDPTVEQIKEISAGKDRLVVGQAAHDSKTKNEMAEKIYEARGRQKEEIDGLSDLRSGNDISQSTADSQNDFELLEENAPAFLASSDKLERTTSSSKGISTPPFIASNISDEFNKAYSGEASELETEQKQTVVADLRAAPDFGAV
ncbi:MAG: hypothetical protein Kilf2KO_28540 [Rhodospirillales bacterium]